MSKFRNVAVVLQLSFLALLVAARVVTSIEDGAMTPKIDRGQPAQSIDPAYLG